MARGPTRSWKQVAPHTEQAFPYVRAALDVGYGVAQQIVFAPHEIVTGDEAIMLRKGLFNAARHMKVSLHCDKAKQPDGSWILTYTVHPKAVGRKYILGKHGPDRTQWPYNPKRPSPRDEAGNRTDV